VTPWNAEKTTIMSRLAARDPVMMSITCRMRSGVPTDDPPNFKTLMAGSLKCEDRLQVL
jgi:hypothetical protein